MQTQLVSDRGVALGAILVLSVALASAQTDTATITGLVTDSSGAAVAGASIQTVNQVNGLEYGTQSNATGNYVIAAMPIGTYDLTATSDGFQTLFRANITLNAGSRARVDVELQVGSITETVEVTADLPLLESETSSLGQAIENTTITQMPLNGRNYQDLAVLTAGVLPSRRQNFVEDAFSVNGAGFDQNVFTLDGADNNNYFSGVVVASNQAVKPSIDAIQEFKMETHNYGAEFGRGLPFTHKSCSCAASDGVCCLGRDGDSVRRLARWWPAGCSLPTALGGPGPHSACA